MVPRASHNEPRNLTLWVYELHQGEGHEPEPVPEDDGTDGTSDNKNFWRINSALIVMIIFMLAGICCVSMVVGAVCYRGRNNEIKVLKANIEEMEKLMSR